MNSRSGRLVAAVFILTTFTGGAAWAEVKPAAVFGNGMVLQREMPVPVWGTAEPGEKVVVSFAGQTKETAADADGKWMLKLDPLKLGKPGVLTVSGKNTVSFSDVLIGDVWVGSGQSNMAGGAGGYAKGDEVLAAMIEAAPYPNLRLYSGSWKEANADSIKGFSAILFSFGQPLQKELDVPVGLIVGAVGGTPSGRWLTGEMIDADPACRKAIGGTLEELGAKQEKALEEWKKVAEAAKKEGKPIPRGPRKPFRPGDLYDAKIKPVVPYAIRGVLWDQGESGTALPNVDQFTTMGALISGWRRAWGQGDFPFLYVQKPSGGGCAWDPEGNPVTRMADGFTPLPSAANNDTKGGEYRELHIRIMQHPNTAMVSSSDLGSGVHPRNKSGYGKRASRVALGFVYGRDVEIYGPIYDSHTIEKDKIRVKFKHVAGGLALRHGDKLQGFEIAGADGKYHWAEATIDGDSVVVSCPEVSEPKNVRYGWAKKRTWANLFNKAGLPALSFRTDK